jgi:hypothetical protein
MRSTVRIDDDLLMELKETARRESVSLTRVLNRTLRAGLRAPRRNIARKAPYTEQTSSMGRPLVDLRKALALASEFDGAEVLRELQLRK